MVPSAVAFFGLNVFVIPSVGLNVFVISEYFYP